MDYSRLKMLLEKFWACETTAGEEEELRFFYTHSREIPADLVLYKDYFVYQEDERKIGLEDDFDRKVLRAIQENRKIHWKKWKRWGQVAAILLLLAGTYELSVENRNLKNDTCQTPEQALAEVKQALNFVSVKMNRGQQLVEENMNEMRTVNRYIK